MSVYGFKIEAALSLGSIFIKLHLMTQGFDGRVAGVPDPVPNIKY